MNIYLAVMTAIPNSNNNVESALLDVLKSADGYVTIPYLAEVTGSSPEVVEQFVESHPREIRKSFMRTEDGKPLLMLNTSLSGISDAWAAFRYINYQK